MLWFRSRCPVRAEEQQWIERSLQWLQSEFGTGVLHREVVLPTAGWFPDPYDGTPDTAHAVLTLVCHRMGIDPAVADLELLPADATAEPPAGTPASGTIMTGSAADRFRTGTYREETIASGCDDATTRYRPGNEPVRVAIRQDLAHHPILLTAALSHQIGHVRLLHEQRITTEQRDHEPLTDLLPIFFGLGIFNANAALQFVNQAKGFRTYRLGYLTEPMFGYALAYYARMRGEHRPAWLTYLDTNPRVFAQQGLRYLNKRDNPVSPPRGLLNS